MDYIPDFIKRKRGEAPIEYDHPMMEPYLKNTYGITVYQEQVMLQSRALGNFTRGMSDTLRKAMGKKQIDTMNALKTQFIEGCNQNPEFVKGCKEMGKDVNTLVEKIWSDWEAFASYAFNKSHSVCYAYIAYQTGYLKAHYPAEFMAANLSCNLSQIEKVTTFMDECKRMGLSVLPPDVNESDQDFAVNRKGDIRFGMAGIKGVGTIAVESILKERQEHGTYKDLYDFFERIDYRTVNRKTLENLILAGGLDSFELHRGQYFYSTDGKTTFLDQLVTYGQKKQQDNLMMQTTLFGGMDEYEVIKPAIPLCEPWTNIELARHEKELIGIYLTSHPLDAYKLEIKAMCTPLEQLTADLSAFKDKEITIAGIIINIRTGKTKKGNDFGIITLEDFEGSYELPFFGEDYIKFRNYFIQETAVYIRGRVQAKKWGSPADLSFNVLSMDLLSEMSERLIKSITLQVDIEQLTHEMVTELQARFVNKSGDTPLNFVLYAPSSGHQVKLFSRTCKITRSKELYEYFEKNDVIKMKIN